MTTLRSWQLSSFCAVLLSGIGSLLAQTPGRGLMPVSAISSPAPADSSAGELAHRDRYHVHPQDSLILSFALSPELNQTVIVQPDGYINLQSAGSVFVQGLTVPELVQAVTKAYTSILNNPIITVDLEDYQKPFFIVSGQVNKPGQYDLRTDITVGEALSVAGGMMPTARTQVLVFHQVSGTWVQVSKVDMKDILKGKRVSEDASVHPGDMIFVPEKFITNFKKYVPYSATTGTYVNP